MKSQILKNLYSQLCDFGLNSKEWVIQPISKSQYLIYHNEDPDFKFIGRTENQSWAKIWLASV